MVYPGTNCAGNIRLHVTGSHGRAPHQRGTLGVPAGARFADQKPRAALRRCRVEVGDGAAGVMRTGPGDCPMLSYAGS